MMKRTPRNFDGVTNVTKKVSDLLPEMLSEIAEAVGDRTEPLFQEWKNILGEEMGKLAEPVLFEDGVLTVKVKSQTLYSLLSTHEKPRLLARLQKKFPVRNIHFRVG